MQANEHYLPQFLLRGFAARSDRGQHYVYQFRRGGKPHLTNVRNTGAERGFYGEVGVTKVESELQTRENEYAPLVERLRQGAVRPADEALIDAFVAHLLGRGRHLRDSVVDIATSAMNASERAMTTDEYQGIVIDMLIERAARNPEVLASLPPELRSQARVMLPTIIHAAVESGATANWVRQAFAELRASNDIRGMAKQGQGEAILREPSPATPRGALTPLVWDVRRTATPYYILGDVGPMAVYSGTERLTTVMRGEGDLQAILLPLSCTALLVGATSAARVVEDSEVNNASTELSREFFVGSSNTTADAEYFNRLGRRATPVYEAQTDADIRKLIDELKKQ